MNKIDEFVDSLQIERFEPGDKINIHTIDHDGVYEIEAKVNGFSIRDKHTIFIVYDKNLIEAAEHRKNKSLIHGTDAFVYDNQEENIDELKVTESDIPNKIYYCDCIDDAGNRKQYSMRKYWKWTLNNKGNPSDFPRSWKDGICLYCGCPLRSDYQIDGRISLKEYLESYE